MTQHKYTTVQGDTWDIVSYKVYNDEHHVDLLMKANTPHIHTVIFPANITLDIPAVVIKESSNLPPWKRGVVIE